MTYWRDLPSLVVAREGDTVTKSQLARERLGATGSDAYLDGWTRGDWTPAEGN